MILSFLGSVAQWSAQQAGTQRCSVHEIESQSLARFLAKYFIKCRKNTVVIFLTFIQVVIDLVVEDLEKEAEDQLVQEVEIEEHELEDQEIAELEIEERS